MRRGGRKEEKGGTEGMGREGVGGMEEGRKDGWMDEWIERWMDGYMDE